jgi:hypothetical protein
LTGVPPASMAPPAAARPAPSLSAPIPAVAPAAAVPPVAPTATSGVAARVPSSPNAAAPVDGVLVSLPAAEESERDALLALAVHERDQLASALGVRAPFFMTLRVHATAAEYERASGRPWFTTGAVVNNEIHLPPVAALRDSGALERMLRRQLVHLLVDQELAKRPAWVREGAALYYGDGQIAQGSTARVTCPTDSELTNPLSAGALATAFSAARSCFERQVTSGRSWREIR